MKETEDERKTTGYESEEQSQETEEHAKEVAGNLPYLGVRVCFLIDPFQRHLCIARPLQAFLDVCAHLIFFTMGPPI